jgi:hypothetical protein
MCFEFRPCLVFDVCETAKSNELHVSQISGMLVNAREYSKVAPQLCNEMLGEYGIMEGFIFSNISARDLNATCVCMTSRVMFSVKKFLHNISHLEVSLFSVLFAVGPCVVNVLVLCSTCLSAMHPCNPAEYK